MKSSSRQTPCLVSLILEEGIEDFSTQVSSRSIFNLGGKVPKCPSSASWWIRLCIFKIQWVEISQGKTAVIHFLKLAGHLAPLQHLKWAANEEAHGHLAARSTSCHKSGEHLELHSSRKNCFQVWGGTEAQCSRTIIPVAHLFLREKMEFGDEFYYFASRSICIKR